MQTDRAHAHLPLLQQVRLVAANLIEAKLIRRTIEVLGELLDRVQIVVDGGSSVVTTLEILQHHLA